MSQNVVKVRIGGDTTEINKALESFEKRAKKTTRQSRLLKKEIATLGDRFQQAANQVSVFSGPLDPISGRLSALATGLNKFGVAAIASGSSVAVLTMSLGKMIKAGDMYEKRQLRFNALLRATGYASRLTRRDLEDLSNEIGDLTLSNTEEASEGVNALTTFRKIQGDVFKETVRLARDSQVAFGGTLRDNVVAFGKALNDPIANLGALSRKGVQFSDSQKEMIRTMWDMGQTAQAQNLILDEMRRQFGGLASAEAKTLEGSIDSLSHAWDRMWESMGRTKIIRFTAEQYRETVNIVTDQINQVNKAHSDESLLQKKSEKLENARLSATRKHVKAKAELANAEARYNAAKSVVNPSYLERDELRRADQSLARIKQSHNELLIHRNNAVTAQRSHYAVMQNMREQDANNRAVASKQALIDEQAELADKLKEMKKTNDKLIRSTYSGFETPRSKVSRQYNENLKTLTNAMDKEIVLTNRMNGSLTSVHTRYDDVMETLHQGKIRRLKTIENIEYKKRKAEELRVERSLKTARSAARSRVKFLNNVSAGASKLAGLRFKFEDDLDKLNQMEFSKTEIADQGYSDRSELVDDYTSMLWGTYKDDVNKFKRAEADKTNTVLLQAAERARRLLNQDLTIKFADIDSPDPGGFEEMFQIDVTSTQEKLKAVELATKEHLERLSGMKLEQAAKDAARDAVESEGKIQQQKIEGDARQKSYSDMWSAMNTLGSSNNKKAFAMSKAASIAQITMKTYEGAMNAYSALSGIPYVGPALGAAAAITITAAGLSRVQSVRQQQMPQFHDGIDYVERPGTYLLDRGERVLDSRLNADLKNDLKRRETERTQSGDVNVSFNIPGVGDMSGFDRWFVNNTDLIVNHLSAAMVRY